MASRAADMNIAGLPQAEAPHRVWWTAGELAELALPGLPGDKRSINRRAQEELSLIHI